MFDPEKHHRRSIRLKGYDYASDGCYFVTLCTCGRDSILGSIVDGAVVLSDLGRLVDEEWLDLPNRFPMIRLGAYVIMPNHIHGITSITRVGANRPPVDPPPNAPDMAHGTKPQSLAAIIQSFKTTCTKAAMKTAGHDMQLWQRNYYEHIVRSQKSLEAITRYIEENPQNWARDADNPKRVGAKEDR